MRPLVVQLWGIGNLVQTEPLLRALGKGDILVTRSRSTQELAPFFPRWNFIPADDGEDISGSWEDVYLCYPVDPRQFRGVANRVHVPTWAWKTWDLTEAETLRDMLGAGYPTSRMEVTPRLSMPHTVPQRAGAVAMSIGYLKDGGWGLKHWGNGNFAQAIKGVWEAGYTTHLFGSQQDFDVDGKEILDRLDLPSSAWKTYFHCPLWEQIEVLAGCRAYLGNDTGLGHVAGALGLPTVVYTVTDRVKNRTAGICHQFGKDLSPEGAVELLVKEVRGAQERA